MSSDRFCVYFDKFYRRSRSHSKILQLVSQAGAAVIYLDLDVWLLQLGSYAIEKDASVQLGLVSRD
jgi:hypothetical protein